MPAAGTDCQPREIVCGFHHDMLRRISAQHLLLRRIDKCLADSLACAPLSRAISSLRTCLCRTMQRFCRAGFTHKQQSDGRICCSLFHRLISGWRRVLGARRLIHRQIVGERAGPQRRTNMHVPGERGGATGTGDLRRGQRIGLIVSAEAAMGMRNADREQPGVAQVGVVFRGETGLTVIVGSARAELLGRKSLSALN